MVRLFIIGAVVGCISYWVGFVISTWVHNKKGMAMEDRNVTLLKAARDFLVQLKKTGSDELSRTVYYDEADCDGYCLLDDINAELELLPENLHKPHWIPSDINSYEFICSHCGCKVARYAKDILDKCPQCKEKMENV